MQINLTDIIVAVIGLLGTIITAWVIPYIKSKTSAAQWNNISSWAKTGVEAAEVIVDGAGQGAKKKQQVYDFIVKKCKDNNIDIDLDTINYAIEKAWADMTGALKPEVKQ